MGRALGASGQQQTSLRRRRDGLDAVGLEHRAGLRRSTTVQERFELGQPDLDGESSRCREENTAESASKELFRVVAWLMQGFMAEIGTRLQLLRLAGREGRASGVRAAGLEAPAHTSVVAGAHFDARCRHVASGTG